MTHPVRSILVATDLTSRSDRAVDRALELGREWNADVHVVHAIERGLFDEELVPEELTQVRMGKIVKDKYPELGEEDQEAVRQHAVAALNFVQQAKKELIETGNAETKNTALIARSCFRPSLIDSHRLCT